MNTSLRARIKKLEHPIHSPCFRLADRLRKARSEPRDETPIPDRIAKLEAAGDPLSLRLARAWTRALEYRQEQQR